MLGVDETLERRRGKKIPAKGIYRDDPVRSSREHFVKTSALIRWGCACDALGAGALGLSRVWSLPFLSALAYSERYAKEHGKRHKTLTEWAWQLLLSVRRWHPEREIVAVADGTYASIELLDRCCRRLPHPITFVVTRLRLDAAALYEPAPPRQPGQQIGRPRLSRALVCLTSPRRWPKTRTRPGCRCHGIADWYGKGERTVEVASETALWYSTGLPAVPLLRWVLIRDPRAEFEVRALCCAPTLTPTPSG